ncbi:MAG: ribonuclease E activity regulator RraA [Methylococcales bacterium]
MDFKTADLCDHFSQSKHFQIAEPLLRQYGTRTTFGGQVTTLKVFEDNVLIRKTLEEKVEGRVLVVDGGGSRRCALIGADLARIASENCWEGIIVYGCIRDSKEINTLSIGIRALHTHPLKSHERGIGDRDTLITIAGVNFKTDHYVYIDEDGIVASPNQLVAPT